MGDLLGHKGHTGITTHTLSYWCPSEIKFCRTKYKMSITSSHCNS
jgi:hypothetical protein